jgi:hypothetical protein
MSIAIVGHYLFKGRLTHGITKDKWKNPHIHCHDQNNHDKASHNANSGVKKHSCFFYDDHHHAPVAIVTKARENGHTLLELWCKLLARDYTNQKVFLVSLVDGVFLQLVVMHIFFRTCDVSRALGAIGCWKENFLCIVINSQMHVIIKWTLWI